MIIGNVKSHADLSKKKQLQKDLLQVEIDNEAEMERRVKDYKNPYTPKSVPQKHKTRAEIIGDTNALIKNIVDKLREMDVDYGVALQVVSYYQNDVDRVVKINALFPAIRRKLLEASIPSLLTAEMIREVINPILRKSEIAFGFTVSAGGFKNVDLLEQEYSIHDSIASLMGVVNNIVRSDADPKLLSEVKSLLARIEDAVLTTEFFAKLKDSVLSTMDRQQLIDDTEGLFHSLQSPTNLQIANILEGLQSSVGDKASANNELRTIKRAFANFTPANLGKFNDLDVRVDDVILKAKQKEDVEDGLVRTKAQQALLGVSDKEFVKKVEATEPEAPSTGNVRIQIRKLILDLTDGLSITSKGIIRNAFEVILNALDADDTLEGADINRILVRELTNSGLDRDELDGVAEELLSIQEPFVGLIKEYLKAGEAKLDEDYSTSSSRQSQLDRDAEGERGRQRVVDEARGRPKIKRLSQPARELYEHTINVIYGVEEPDAGLREQLWRKLDVEEREVVTEMVKEFVANMNADATTVATSSSGWRIPTNSTISSGFNTAKVHPDESSGTSEIYHSSFYDSSKSSSKSSKRSKSSSGSSTISSLTAPSSRGTIRSEKDDLGLYEEPSVGSRNSDGGSFQYGETGKERKRQYQSAVYNTKRLGQEPKVLAKTAIPIARNVFDVLRFSSSSSSSSSSGWGSSGSSSFTYSLNPEQRSILKAYHNGGILNTRNLDEEQIEEVVAIIEAEDELKEVLSNAFDKPPDMPMEEALGIVDEVLGNILTTLEGKLSGEAQRQKIQEIILRDFIPHFSNFRDTQISKADEKDKLALLREAVELLEADIRKTSAYRSEASEKEEELSYETPRSYRSRASPALSETSAEDLRPVRSESSVSSVSSGSRPRRGYKGVRVGEQFSDDGGRASVYSKEPSLASADSSKNVKPNLAKSALGVKIAKKATEYFRDKFLPELEAKDEKEQRALLRNITAYVSKSGYKTSFQYESDFNKPLTEEEMDKLLGELEEYYVMRQIETEGTYVPTIKGQQRGYKGEKLTHGLGVKKAKAKNSVGRGRNPSKKVMEKIDEDLESESSSDEEVVKAKAKPIFKASRIKVGGGIKVEEEPRYKQFGKYAIHIPQLHNNTANFKYGKSLGTIPSIRPMSISDDYKDFILDVIKNGKMNEKELSRLKEDEQKHFGKVVSGAGLIDTFNLKKIASPDEKKDGERFNLLRGEYLAGNNAPTLIKELRSYILKFMDEGRIKRKDGMGLLAELAVSV